MTAPTNNLAARTEGLARRIRSSSERGSPFTTAGFARMVERAGAPEILEPARRQLGVSHRVLDVAVAKISLQRSRIVALWPAQTHKWAEAWPEGANGVRGTGFQPPGH